MCNGCKGKYDKSTQTLCIQHEVWRTFTPHASTEKQTHSGNVYYIIVTLPVFVHFWPTFEHTTVVAPIEVQARMLPNISICDSLYQNTQPRAVYENCVISMR